MFAAEVARTCMRLDGASFLGKSREYRRSVARALAGPMAILVLLPLLVLGVGLFVSLTAWSQARQSIVELAKDDFLRRARSAAWRVEEALDQGHTALDALRNQVARRPELFTDPNFDVRQWSADGREIHYGRPALAFLACATVTGNYFGIYRDPASPTGIVVTDRKPQDGATLLKNYHSLSVDAEPFRVEPQHGFDARTEEWYRNTLRENRRTLTGPYIWFDLGLPALTLAEPIYAPDGELLGALEADFNMNTLSEMILAVNTDPDFLVFLCNAEGQILAFPGFHQDLGQDEQGKGVVPTATEIDDVRVKAFFDGDRLSSPADVDIGRFQTAGHDYVWTTDSVLANNDVVWEVVSIGDIDVLLAPAVRHRTRSLWIVGGALAAATALAIAFARTIVRYDSRVRVAERDAKDAKDAIRQIGAYQLVRCLGAGGMGEVWLGKHAVLARPVAVKLIHSGHFEEMTPMERQRAISRFDREAQALAQLRSPNTIAIYDFGVSDEGTLFYVMELLDGMDLAKLVAEFGPPPVGRVINILRDAAKSLAEAHDKGLVHRDVKPANIYLCRLGGELDVVKVLDFGIVRSQDVDVGDSRLTMKGSIEGTPAYMAPEQAEGTDQIDARADVYALACVGYFLLQGSDLFGRTTAVASLIATIKEPAPRLSQVVRVDIPAALDDLLLRCLSKDPSDRPVDMHTFLRELQEISLEPQQRWTDEQCRSWWTQIPVFDAYVDQTPGQKHLVPDERGTALTQELYRDTISQAETAESPLAEPRADETTHLDVRESS